MRRKDRQIDAERARQALEEATFATLSMCDGETPYGIPVSFALIGDAFYFHSAEQGRKTEVLAASPRVFVSAVNTHQVPGPITDDEYEETMAADGSIAVFLKTHFTTEFQSATFEGDSVRVADAEEKRRALRAICEKYTPFNEKYIDDAVELGLGYTAVYRIQIENLTGKEKKL